MQNWVFEHIYQIYQTDAQALPQQQSKSHKRKKGLMALTIQPQRNNLHR